MTSSIDVVLARLDKPRKTGKGWTARCPAHEDKSPSLSITEADGSKVLLHCFAGCKADEVLTAIGLEWKDLFPESLSPDARRDYQRKAATQAKAEAELVIAMAQASATLSPEDAAYLGKAQANAKQAKEMLAHLDSPEPDPEADTIKRLAALSDLAYFKLQKASADALSITTGQLDKLRNAERKRQATEAGSAESGSNVLFDEVEPWPQPVNGAALLDELSATVRRFVVCERHTADAAALWLAFTWCIDAVTVAPIANITAPLPNCGKSTMLDLFERLTFRPLKADNISPAALFRSIEKWRPSLLIDEVDAFLKDNEDARGILNSGHKRNGYVLRVVGDDFEPRRFSTWGAKALCGIGSIAATLQSRSIRLELRRKLPGETVENLRHVEDATIERLQRHLARFAEDAQATIRTALPAPVPGLSNRAQDNWEPLLAIADAAGGEWPQRVRRTAQAITGAEASNDAPDANTELLTDIRATFDRKRVDRLSSADMLAVLCEDEEAPWATWNRGRPMTARQLSARLGEFGVVSGTVRFGTHTAKGYTLDKFTDAFSRYLSSPGVSSVTTSQASNDAGLSDFPIRHNAGMLRIEKPIEASNDAGCDVVTDRKGGTHAILRGGHAPAIEATWEEGKL
ncbi:MAG: hypothetical protein K0Q68_589 [Moraxellaceae bacterium]|jgi:hypothetical protein|nr:hypothetical protein [Moraxellaceae bacterium]